MMKSLIVLVKVFLLIELVLSFIVVTFFFFFEGVNYLAEGVFNFYNLWHGLKGASFGAIPASLVYWFAYHFLPLFKR